MARTYSERALLLTVREDHSSGQETWTWYSMLPLLTLHRAMFGRTFCGNADTTGVKVQFETLILGEQEPGQRTGSGVGAGSRSDRKKPLARLREQEGACDGEDQFDEQAGGYKYERSSLLA